MHVGFSHALSAMIQCFSLTTDHRYRYASQSTKMVHTRGTRRMLLKIEQHRRLEMPRGSQSHPLRCASRKGHVQTRRIHRCHLVISNRYSSQTSSVLLFDPSCGARRMLLRWLHYNVLIHIDCNIDLYVNRSLLSYMEFQCKVFVIVYVIYF